MDSADLASWSLKVEAAVINLVDVVLSRVVMAAPATATLAWTAATADAVA